MSTERPSYAPSAPSNVVKKDDLEILLLMSKMNLAVTQKRKKAILAAAGLEKSTEEIETIMDAILDFATDDEAIAYCKEMGISLENPEDDDNTYGIGDTWPVRFSEEVNDEYGDDSDDSNLVQFSISDDY